MAPDQPEQQQPADRQPAQPDSFPPPASPVGGEDAHPGEPESTGTHDPSAPQEPTQPDEGLGSETPDTTVDGQPAVQQGTETGPAPGPSPDAGGTTQP